MKHETLNSIIAVCGFLLAGFSTLYQFRESPDNIAINIEGPVQTNNVLNIDSYTTTGFYDDDSPHVLAGPTYWKVVIFNDSDKPVSIIGKRLYLILEQGGEAFYSRIGGNFYSSDKSLSPISLPHNIEPYEAKGFLIDVTFPIVSGDEDDQKCHSSNKELREIEECFYRLGRDLFGNKVDAKFGTDGAINYVQWKSQKRQPRFMLEIHTADGSEFKTQLKYFPSI